MKIIKPYPSADPATVIMLYIAFFGLIFGFIRWCIKRYITKYPFYILEAYEGYDFYKTRQRRTLYSFTDPIRIFCLNNKIVREKITLYFEARRTIKLTRINIRFVDMSTNKIAIDKVFFPQAHLSFNIEFKPDEIGGFDGYVNPPIEIPKKTILFFEIYPQININEKLKCKISLENASSGEERRTFTRKRVIISNEVI